MLEPAGAGEAPPCEASTANPGDGSDCATDSGVAAAYAGGIAGWVVAGGIKASSELERWKLCESRESEAPCAMGGGDSKRSGGAPAVEADSVSSNAKDVRARFGGVTLLVEDEWAELTELVEAEWASRPTKAMCG